MNKRSEKAKCDPAANEGWYGRIHLESQIFMFIDDTANDCPNLARSSDLVSILADTPGTKLASSRFEEKAKDCLTLCRAGEPHTERPFN